MYSKNEIIWRRSKPTSLTQKYNNKFSDMIKSLYLINFYKIDQFQSPYIEKAMI